ncbi:MAG: Kelch repeat-containing protein, partial [Blastocatellia bacterium]
DVVASNPQSTQARLAGAFSYVAPTPPTVRVLAPSGGETAFTGGVMAVRWQSSDNRAIARHRIALYRSSATEPVLIASISNEVAGEAQSFNWTIPITTSPTTLARIRVTAVDDEGVETEAFSTADFTIDRRWAPSTPLTGGLNRLAVTSAGQFLYAIGGRTTTNNSSAVATVQRLDLSSGAPMWSSLAPLPVELNAIEAATIQGKIYAPGGFTRQATIDRNTRIYDIAGDSWSAQAPPPTGVGNYAMAADAGQGVLYVTGGSDLIAAVSNVQVYNTGANTWQALPPMKAARFAHEAALINSKLYVVGGAGTSGGLADGEVFDFQTGQWSPIASLNQPRFYAINSVARNESGQLFWLVFGGANPDTGAPLRSAEAYDVANNRWIALDGSFALPTARTFFNGAAHGGFLHAVGGSTTGTNTVTFNDRFKLDGFTLINPNQPPLVVVPPVQQIAIPNQELKFTVSAQDLGSGAPITITAEGLPGGAVFNTANDTNNSARGEFRWTPQSPDVGRSFTVDFTASDGILKDVKSVVIRVVSATTLTLVNAADFHLGPLAADSIVAAFGSNLANRTESAQSLPLPTSLAGTKLTINGVPAPLFFVSPTQINFVVPPELAELAELAIIGPGSAVVIASSPAGTYALGAVQIVAAAPGIFTADSTGAGDAAALATIDGVNYQQPPFDVLVNGNPNVLLLYGTGIRRAPAANPGDDNGVAESVSVTIDGRSARVLFAGAQGSFSGLDQLNIEMPAALTNTGPRRVEVVVTVNNIVANRVTIQIK